MIGPFVQMVGGFSGGRGATALPPSEPSTQGSGGRAWAAGTLGAAGDRAELWGKLCDRRLSQRRLGKRGPVGTLSVLVMTSGGGPQVLQIVVVDVIVVVCLIRLWALGLGQPQGHRRPPAGGVAVAYAAAVLGGDGRADGKPQSSAPRFTVA